MKSNKSTENTVFVRFSPASPDVNRWHLENLFSGIGPIRKCSVISSTDKDGLGYGFVKFVSGEDAESSATKYNNTYLDVEGKQYKLKVELASKPVTSDSSKRSTKKEKSKQMGAEIDGEILAKKKRTSRVILRNLSFYANEKNVKSVMEKEFGPVVEVTLPRVNEKLHRGFAFVTFHSAMDARKATQARKSPVEIKRRPVAIDFAVAKAIHQKSQNDDIEKAGGINNDENSFCEDYGSCDKGSQNDNESNDSNEDESKSDKSDDSESKTSTDSDGEESEENDEDEGEEKIGPPSIDEGVTDKRTVFIRNLPFDMTRHDIFELMRQFGKIESIHPVMDKTTQVFKGSAFCEFKKAEFALKALEVALSSTTPTRLKDNLSSEDGLSFRGRRVYLDLAVDKQTASTLALEKQGGEKAKGKDKRSLYLKDVGYIPRQIDNPQVPASKAWENVPVNDQLKRYRASAEKATKLKSPLFFINPKRLSIRNLAKHIDETQLKSLCVQATKRGLDNHEVKEEDQIAHLRATRDITTRDILKIIEEAKEKNESIIPMFNEKNIKQFIPSVFINREFSLNKKEKGVSRGFGFVDFLHHAHALACMRELNNNIYYSADFVIGGKRAQSMKKDLRKNTKRGGKGPSASDYINEDGKVLLPRLIVDFTVENKKKAQQQAANRAKQQANVEKQQLELRFDQQQRKKGAELKKKASRGATQRAKKRKQREEGSHAASSEPLLDKSSSIPKKSLGKPTSPPVSRTTFSHLKNKKRKITAEDQSFEELVKSYTSTFRTLSKPLTQSTNSQDRSCVAEKRWYE